MLTDGGEFRPYSASCHNQRWYLMRWRKYAQIALSIESLLLIVVQSYSEFVHGEVSFVEVRHGLDKCNFLFSEMPKHGIVQGLYVDLSKECMLR